MLTTCALWFVAGTAEARAELHAALPGGVVPGPEMFFKVYASMPRVPWDIGKAQPAIVEAEAAGKIVGPKVLDAGCGMGDLSIFLASKGYDVTGVDLVPIPIARAKERLAAAGDLSGSATFVVGDVFAPGFAPASFDTLVDSASFHCYGDDDALRRYVASMSPLIRTGGKLVVLVFSDVNPDPWVGPRRISEAHARALWEETGLWKVDEVIPTYIHTHIHDTTIGEGHAILLTATRL